MKELSHSTSSNLDEVQPDEMGNSVLSINPHVSEASREVANLTLTPIISGTAKQNGLKKIRTSMAKTHVSKKDLSKKWLVGLVPKAKTAAFQPNMII